MDLKKLIPTFGKKRMPVRREEEHPFLSLQCEMNRVFDTFLQGWGAWEPESMNGFDEFTPRIDMKEDDKAVMVAAELPGMVDQDIEVALNRDTLTIRGEKKDEKEERKENCLYSERTFGSFSRTVRIPHEIDSDKVQARFRKGILTITLPKLKGADEELRKISVKAE